MITPTVGRIVHYHPEDLMVPTMPAIITYVHDDRVVDLAVFSPTAGQTCYLDEITLWQPGDLIPHGEFCAWMPYQVRKDTGSESGESGAGVEAI